MGIERMPEARPTHRFEPVRSYMTHDWAAVRATAPMSKRASDANRRAKPGMAKTRRTRGGRGRLGETGVDVLVDIGSTGIQKTR